VKAIEELQRQLSEGRLNRRDFISRATALGVTASMATGLWSDSALAAPKQGGRLRIGIGQGSTSDSLDPATYLDTYMQTVGSGGLRNNLTEINNDGKLIPELASSFESSDGKTWIFKVRKGVEFHNGKTLDANDVVASIRHHTGEDSKSAAKGILESVSDIRADGKDTVIIELKSGNADFPYIVSDYHIGIMPAKDGGVDWESGVGTGGYSKVSFNPGVRTLLKRNPNYFKQGRAHFDEVEALVIADVNARTNALKTGEVDVMNRCELKTVHLLKRTPGLQVLETTGTQHFTFAMLMDVPPFDNNHVRLALKLGLDREQMLKTVLRGHGALGNDHPISTANRYHADLAQRHYDPDRAKWHLKQAGMSSVKVSLSAADAAFAGAVDAAVLYKENAAKAGIDINVVREPDDGYWSDVWLKKAWCAVYWGGRPTEDWMFSTAYARGVPWNDTHFDHARFNELLVAARTELDEFKRGAMYAEMQRIVRDEGGVVVPLFANYVVAMSDKVKHDKQIAANWDLDGFKCVERWWFG